VTYEEEAMKSFPKARQAVLFQRAIVNARRRKQAAAPAASKDDNAVKSQQDRLCAAFSGRDAA
jgi:hypothetical protein